MLEEYQKRGLLAEIQLRWILLNLNEIQSNDAREIAMNSVKQAYSIKKPLAVSGAGLYIESLNDFPGLFLKQMNQWFGSEEILGLLQE